MAFCSDKLSKKNNIQTGFPNKCDKQELYKNNKVGNEDEEINLSDNDEDQVKIEDQGNFLDANESRESRSEEKCKERQAQDNSKQRHLFYIKNIHDDAQELSPKDNSSKIVIHLLDFYKF